MFCLKIGVMDICRICYISLFSGAVITRKPRISNEMAGIVINNRVVMILFISGTKYIQFHQ